MKKITLTPEEIDKIIAEIKEKSLAGKGIKDTITVSLNPKVVLKKEDKVELVFENTAYKKMNALINASSKEVGWYATAIRENDKKFVVTDILVPPQKVTGVTVTTDEEEYTAWHDSLTDDQVNQLKFYGHSHVYMGTSPSATDETYYKNTIQNARDFYIFGIFNKKSESWLNIYDFTNNTLYENDDITYKYYVADEDRWAEEQIKLHVKEETFATTVTSTKKGKNKDEKKTDNVDLNNLANYDSYWSRRDSGYYSGFWDRYYE